MEPDYHKEWRKRNRYRIRAYNKARYDREQNTESMRKWRSENIEHYREYQREYQRMRRKQATKREREVFLAKQKEYRERKKREGQS